MFLNAIVNINKKPNDDNLKSSLNLYYGSITYLNNNYFNILKNISIVPPSQFGAVYNPSSVPSPTPSTNNLGLYYGGNITTYASYNGTYSISVYIEGYKNVVNTIDSNGSLLIETSAGTARTLLAGAPVGGNGLFYGGIDSHHLSNYSSPATVTILNSSGALIGTETSAGSGRYGLAGAAVGGNGLFYGGNSSPTGAESYSNTVTRIDSTGSLVGSETNVGSARPQLAGAAVGGNGLFRGGNPQAGYNDSVSLITFIDANGSLVGTETSVGTGVKSLAGSSVGGNGLFYAGYISASGNTNLITRIDATGSLVGNETNAGTARNGLGGASVDSYGLFYGGVSSTESNTITRINSNGAQVGVETNGGTARYNLAGTGLTS